MRSLDVEHSVVSFVPGGVQSDEWPGGGWGSCSWGSARRQELQKGPSLRNQTAIFFFSWDTEKADLQ